MLSFTLTLLPSIKNLFFPEQTPLVHVHTQTHTHTQPSVSVFHMKSLASNYRSAAERPVHGLNWWRSTLPPTLHSSISVSVPTLLVHRFSPSCHIKMGANPRGPDSHSLAVTHVHKSGCVKMWNATHELVCWMLWREPVMLLWLTLSEKATLALNNLIQRKVRCQVMSAL